MMRHFLSREFVLFLLTGGLAAAVNFGSRIVYSRWMEFSPAVVLAYLTGMVTAFLLARAFVFTAGTQDVRRSALFFILVNVVAVAQTWTVSMALALYVLPAMGIARHAQEIAHAAGVVVPVFSSFLGHKRYSFR
jgi:putative flippase GtrA